MVVSTLLKCIYIKLRKREIQCKNMVQIHREICSDTQIWCNSRLISLDQLQLSYEFDLIPCTTSKLCLIDYYRKNMNEHILVYTYYHQFYSILLLLFIIAHWVKYTLHQYYKLIISFIPLGWLEAWNENSAYQVQILVKIVTLKYIYSWERYESIPPIYKLNSREDWTLQPLLATSMGERQL